MHQPETASGTCMNCPFNLPNISIGQAIILMTARCFSAGACPSAEQLGELLHGDPDGDWPVGLHHELHHWQEQEQPPRSGLVQLTQRTSREQLCTSG